MAAATGLDREDEFDISDGEEALLSQLVADLPTPQSHERPSLEASVANVSRLVANHGHLVTSAQGLEGVTPPPAEPGLAPYLPDPDTLSTRLPRNDEIVSYPDCMSQSWRTAAVKLTDQAPSE